MHPRVFSVFDIFCLAIGDDALPLPATIPLAFDIVMGSLIFHDGIHHRWVSFDIVNLSSADGTVKVELSIFMSMIHGYGIGFAFVSKRHYPMVGAFDNAFAHVVILFRRFDSEGHVDLLPFGAPPFGPAVAVSHPLK
jgi:hypothetical protein